MKSAVLSLLVGGKFASAASSTWDYDHQDEWQDTYSMCNNNDQSPIDIVTSEVVIDSTCIDFDWNMNYSHSTFRMLNNGHALVLQAVTPSNLECDGDCAGTYYDEAGDQYYALGEEEDTIARFENKFRDAVNSDHDEFCLDSFHFHWGSSDLYGSEHYVDGAAYPLEVHFVHYSCAHNSLGATLFNFGTEDQVSTAESAGTDVHQLGVVGIFFDVVNESNPAFDAIFDNGHFEDVQYPDKRDFATIVNNLDLAELIPDDIETAGYYAYEGSLTTPPCTDIVRWHVMNARGTIGVDQMDKFRHLLADVYGTNAAPNYRELQDNVNTVTACMEGDNTDDTTEDESTGTDTIVVAVYGVLIMICQCLLGVFCCMKQKRGRKDGRSQPMVAPATTDGRTDNAHH